jgi:hypothetical protein
MKGEERRSYIEIIMKKEKDRPSPLHYSPEKKARIIGGKLEKANRIPFTSNHEYLSATVPAASMPDVITCSFNLLA